MKSHYFHFTLGPVQGFVAQARRTRDFWAGSFLLSWLSAVAMQAVIKQHGVIIFPKVSSDYLDWLENKGQYPSPKQGCVPNRFKGGLAKVPQDFNPNQVTQSVQLAWQAIAEQVWQQDLSGCDPNTRAIWDRQVSQFWEISWVLSDDETESNLLDRRKNWRSYLPPEEAGVKCMMMDGWQELSGISTPNAKGLNQFWERIRQQGDTTLISDLRENEYLCATAFIKRRFAHCFEDLKVAMPGGWTLHGWKVSSSVPSVAYIAAAPWLAQVLRQAPETALKTFHDAAKKLTHGYGEYPTWLDCIDQAVLTRGDGQLFWNSKSLDGNVFFESALENKNIYPDQTQAKRVKSALKALRDSITDKNITPVSPFYAVLMMDGDSLGSYMSDINNQKSISEGLESFTQGVQAIVEKHSGFLVYAGGDDVLALLPLEYALNCAKALRDHYLKSFKEYPSIKTTLSGAIEYAHIKMPLGKVLADAHHLLDAIAKDTTGRDAIAVRVWKPGGLHLEWSIPWKKAIDSITGEVCIDRLACDFQKDQQDTPFSSSFFFHVRDRFAMLNDNAERHTDFPFDQSTMIDLIAADYLNSGVNHSINSNEKITMTLARSRVKTLLEQCFFVYRSLAGGNETFKSSNRLNSNALQLVRFLAEKGVEHG